MSSTMTVTETDVSAVEGSPRHSQHMDETETVVFNDCKTGLGIKIIGGRSEQEGGRDYGIFIRRVIPGGLAEQSGRLKEGDQILSVNSASLLRVTNDEAVQHLRSASATNQVTMVVTRNMSAAHRFSLLLESQLANTRNTFNLDTQSVSSDQGSDIHEQGSKPWSSLQRERISTQSPSPSLDSSSSVQDELHVGPGSANQRKLDVREIILNKLSGLGLSISGGVDRHDGPGIYIQGIQQDGDCARDGRLRVGDQLVSVNGDQLSGTTNEVAVEILTRASCRTDVDTLRINYIPVVSAHSYRQPNNHTPSSSYPSPSNTNQSPSPHHRYSSHPTSPLQPSHTGHQHPQGSADVSQRVAGGLLSPEGEVSQSTAGGEALPQRLGQPVSPPLYEQATINGFPLSALRQQAPSNIAMPLHLQRHLHIQPASSSTPQANNANGHLNRFPVPHSTHLEPSPVLPTNSITMATHHPNNLSSAVSPSATPTIDTWTVKPSLSLSNSRRRRLSLDPHVRLRIDKLQVALKYLGIEPTEEENAELRCRLQVDQSGMVPYGEFVAVSRQIFKMQLDDSRLGAGSLTFAAQDVTDFAEPPPFHQQQDVPSSVPVSELDRVRQERDEALREVERLKVQLQEKDRSFNIAEEELLRVRKEAQGAIHESRALKSRVHLAEAAQREARNIEIDYEEVVHMLEAEVAKLQKKTCKTPPPNKVSSADIEELQKRIAVMSCELRKAEISKKTYEVATEKLLQFAELVHECISNGPNAITISNTKGRGESARRGDTGFIPSGYLAKHNIQGPLNLGSEAKETVKAVKKMLEVEPLPYGWEEAYTADGMKYYLHHVSQGTTWIHPVSSINHLPSIDENGRDVPETRT
ncbi:syntaxin-binding protein 4-like [Patiria miniata]|uniref:Syntaxin-binding protein 4 n=1 Tax=Patiria miniata TaxID=46514 RepID=A0A913ZV41_PATMI|nr:syntaxin-binding protein 4-like [Patiria miniata]XP_038055418.1 syntaxin-binding protein 4-like [Patiria miniata]